MKPIYLICLTAIMPTLALADIEPACEELWYSRNAMLNDAGYCFSSPLGRSLFDNADCTTRSPSVSRDVAEQISRIQKLETQAPDEPDGICRIDTNQTSLAELRHISLRQRLTFHPSTDGVSSACIGYRGEQTNLYAAPDDTSEVIGRIPTGASVSNAHLPWEDWRFAIVLPPTQSGQSVMLGWYRGDIMADAAMTGVSENCAFIAG